MSAFYYILMTYCFLVVILSIMILTAKPYPKELEEEENREIKKKFDEYSAHKNTCEHKHIISEDGCDECLDCGVRNY